MPWEKKSVDFGEITDEKSTDVNWRQLTSTDGNWRQLKATDGNWRQLTATESVTATDCNWFLTDWQLTGNWLATDCQLTANWRQISTDW